MIKNIIVRNAEKTTAHKIRKPTKHKPALDRYRLKPQIDKHTSFVYTTILFLIHNIKNLKINSINVIQKKLE